MEEWHQLIGIIGMLLYLGSYFALQLGYLQSESYRYCLLNTAAASMVMFSLLFEFNLASALIQIAWIVISLVGISRIMLGKTNRQSYRRSRRRRRRHHPRNYHNAVSIRIR